MSDKFLLDYPNERVNIVSQNNMEAVGTVAYWITRDNRAQDNWAFIYAYYLAQHHRVPLIVLKNIPDDLYHANRRTFGFFINGLEGMIHDFSEINVPVHVTEGNPSQNIKNVIRKFDISHIITDFDVLKPNIRYKREAFWGISVNRIEIDTHNIVPCRYVSDKQELAARTIRPKINKLLDRFLTEIPQLQTYSYNTKRIKGLCIASLEGLKNKYDFGPEMSPRYLSGRREGIKTLNNFILTRLENYAKGRNEPADDNLSDLSPYVNYGFISRQRIALKILEATNSANKSSSEVFLEELIVRAELAENFCFYNQNYDSVKCFPGWARETLAQHNDDRRDYLYNLDEFEKAQTHDPAWNAAQLQLTTEGKMHGYMRMYWAKKILEWTENYELAYEIALYLNDKYQLDGRDPNGFVGVAWSIGGVHDQGWKERDIFGKIRYMNYNGLKRKFDIKKYEDRYLKNSLF